MGGALENTLLRWYIKYKRKFYSQYLIYYIQIVDGTGSYENRNSFRDAIFKTSSPAVQQGCGSYNVVPPDFSAQTPDGKAG